MNVLHLGPPDEGERIKKAVGLDTVWSRNGKIEPLDVAWQTALVWADWIISWRYRFKVPTQVLQKFPGQAINLHAGLVQYVRGVRPVFFTLFKQLPLGVTLHQMTEEYDAGPILGCSNYIPHPGTIELCTLNVMWRTMNHGALMMLERWWPMVKGHYINLRNVVRGPIHTMAEFDELWGKLELREGWNTTVKEMLERKKEVGL